MSIISDILNIPSAPGAAFYIYDNTYVAPTNANATTKNTVALPFTSLIQSQVIHSSNVAVEPLEQSNFASDSKQNLPTSLQLNASYTPYATDATTTPEELRIQVNSLITKIKEYKDGTKLVTVAMQNSPLYDIYPNYTITEFRYHLSPTQTAFIAELKLQEVRITTTQYGKLPANQVTNLDHSSIQDNGQQSPTNVDPYAGAA